MFDSIIILNDFDSTSSSVSKEPDPNKKPNKLKVFYKKIKTYIIKNKPVFRFMKIYININALFKLIADVIIICTIPSNAIMYYRL